MSNELKEFTGSNRCKIAIPVSKITGFTETPSAASKAYGNCFIATGADDPEGGENGWYVIETYDEVKAILENKEK